MRGCLAVCVATAGRRWHALPELGSAACPGERVERPSSVLSTCEAFYVELLYCDGGGLSGRAQADALGS